MSGSIKNISCFVILSAVFSSAGASVAQIEDGQGKLMCGDAVVKSKTQYFNDASYIERQVIKQDIAVYDTKGNLKKGLQLDGRVINKPTFHKDLLDSRVSAWACLTAKNGKHYIFLWYSCTPIDEQGFCTGENKEWELLFQTDGKALTNTYRHDDTRYDVIYKKLGLENAVANVQLQPLEP